MSALLLHAVEVWRVRFDHIPLGGLFAFQGRFYVRVSESEGRPVARRNREPAARRFVGAVVQGVRAQESTRFFITEFLEFTENGATLNRMPTAEWPLWSADLQRELFPVEPRPAIHRDPGRWAPFRAALGRTVRSLGVLLASIALAPLRAIRAARTPTVEGSEFVPLHDWKCDGCGTWNPDWRDENPCAKCGHDRPAICEYRKVTRG